MRAYVINIMFVLIIFLVIRQTDINVITLSIGKQGDLKHMLLLLLILPLLQCTTWHIMRVNEKSSATYIA